MKDIEKELEELKKAYSELKTEILNMQKNLIKQAVKEAMEELKKEESPLKKEILRGLRKRRKNIIKKKILDLIREDGVELSELKYLIVEQLSYCSKASFYRYVEELKEAGLLFITTIDNKNIVLKSLKRVRKQN